MAFQDPARVFTAVLDDAPALPSAPPIGGSALFWRAKRGFDIAMSLLLLPVLAVVVAALALLNPVFNPGPLFFHQTRMGRFCAPFTAWKLRSMRPAPEGPARGPHDPPEAARITPLGLVLRRTRIDELPQILNVLRGEMSLIGPRPDAWSHAAAFLHLVPGYRARHAVRPGISGLAQVTLGYAVGVEATRAKTAADLAYLRAAGPALEARIVWRTLVTVAQRRGS